MCRVSKTEHELPVLVLGAGGCNALGVARAFGRRSIPVFLMNPRIPLEHRLSRYGVVFRCPVPVLGDPAFAMFVVNWCKRRGVRPVLICTNDRTTSYVSKYYEMLSPWLRYTFAPHLASDILINKAQFYRLAERLGIDHPQTYYPMSEAEALQAARIIGYPVLLKPALSHEFADAFHCKCFLIRSDAQLRWCWRSTSEAGLSMLVQQNIQGAGIYMWYGYYDAASRRIAACGYRKVRQFPPDYGVGALVSTFYDQGLIDVADHMLRYIGYTGIVEPEFIRDRVSGQWKLLEVNARTSTQNRLPAALGLDMEYLAYREACGEAMRPQAMPDRRVLWTETHKDFASAFSSEDMSVRRWLKSRRGRKIYAIFSADDPMPAVARVPEAIRDVGVAVIRHYLPGLFEIVRARRSYRNILRDKVEGKL